MVAGGTTSGSTRPFDSTKWDANNVLIKVDLPRPVWPIIEGQVSYFSGIIRIEHPPTTITLNWKPRLRSLCSICRVIATATRVS